MIARGPLVYWSLPVGLALVLGLLWGRRKKQLRDDDGDAPSSSKSSPSPVCDSSTTDPLQTPRASFKHSVSVPITGATPATSISPTDLKLVPVLPEERSVDDEYDALLSDDESPRALSDSGDRRRRRFSFGKRTVREGNPVVVKATKPAKISPEHSFVECKYAAQVDANGNDQVANEPPVQTKLSVNAQTAASNKLANKLNNNALTKNSKLDSPSSSLSSMQSKDSGKGSTPPRFDEPITTYDFLVRQEAVGAVLGRKGAFVREIKKNTQASVLIKLHPTSDALKIVSVEGTQEQIDEALKILRDRLKPKRYPGLTMKQVFLPSRRDVGPLNAGNMQISLDLIESINNDVTISSIITGGHMFMQQPVHPTYPSLATLHRCMNNAYTHCKTVPLSDEQIVRDVVCAAKINSFWYRMKIGHRQPGSAKCIVKFLDYGGYTEVNVDDLRQIRGDFLLLPFQAIECVLANVRPVDGHEERWNHEAVEVLDELSRGKTLQAQVAGYNDDGLPEVLLYVQLTPNRVVFINGELVARQLAQWTTNVSQA